MGTKVIGIDPGLTTGIAVVLGPELHVINAFTVTDDMINDWLMDELPTHEPTHVVYEDYIQEAPEFVRPGDQWPQPTAKICGAIILACHQHKIPCIRQSRTIKPDGYRMMGKTYVKGKGNMHREDATAHAVYLIRNGTNGRQVRYFDYQGTAKRRQVSGRHGRRH